MRGASGQGKEKGKILARFQGLPKGTLVPIEALLEALAADGGAGDEGAQGSAGALPRGLARPEEPLAPAPQSWRTLLWTVPAETRIGREELLEAVGRPRSWVYRQTAAKAEHRIPHRKLDGELVFVVGEVRAWLKAQEEIVQAGPLDGPRLAVAR